MPLKTTLAPTVAAARVDLEAACAIIEDGVEDCKGEEKPQYPPLRQYIRSLAWLRPFLALAALYCLGLTVLWALYSRLPDLATLEALARQQGATGEVVALRMALPHSFDELRGVRRTIELYRVHYGPQLVQLMTGAYLFLQAFMTPGCVAINILMGSMYSFWVAFIYVGVVSTIGASLNYCLVRLLLKEVVSNVLPGRVAAFSKEVRRHQAHLLNYMLFIRATPILPGWFVNLASPIVGVPYPIFLIATFVGHQPLNFFTVEAGVALSTIHSMRDLYSPRNVAFMLLVGMVFLVPVFLKWRRQRNRRKGEGSGGGAGAGGVQARAVNILVGPGESPHQH